MKAFGWWAASEAFDQKWAIENLESALQFGAGATGPATKDASKPAVARTEIAAMPKGNSTKRYTRDFHVTGLRRWAFSRAQALPDAFPRDIGGISTRSGG